MIPPGGDGEAKTVIVNLDTPIQTLVRIFTYNETVPQELYVPALLFPIKDSTEESAVYRSGIVVPLAEELWNSTSGLIRIMEAK